MDSNEEKDAGEKIVPKEVIDPGEVNITNKVIDQDEKTAQREKRNIAEENEAGEEVFQNVVIDLVKEIVHAVNDRVEEFKINNVIVLMDTEDEKDECETMETVEEMDLDEAIALMQAKVDEINALDKEISDEIVKSSTKCLDVRFSVKSLDEEIQIDSENETADTSFSYKDELDKYYHTAKERIAVEKIALNKEIEKEVETIALYQEVLDELDVEMAAFSKNEPALTKLLNKYYLRTFTKLWKMELKNNKSWLQRKKIWLQNKKRRCLRRGEVASENKTMIIPFLLNHDPTKGMPSRPKMEILKENLKVREIIRKKLVKLKKQKRTRERIEKEKEDAFNKEIEKEVETIALYQEVLDELDKEIAAFSKNEPVLTEPKMEILKENLKVREIIRKKLVELEKQLDGSNVTEKVQSSIQPPTQSNVQDLDSNEPIVSSNTIEFRDLIQYCFIDTNKKKVTEVLLVSSNTVENTKDSVEPENNERDAYYPEPPNIVESTKDEPKNIEEDSTSCEFTLTDSFQVSGLDPLKIRETVERGYLSPANISEIFGPSHVELLNIGKKDFDDRIPKRKKTDEPPMDHSSHVKRKRSSSEHYEYISGDDENPSKTVSLQDSGNRLIRATDYIFWEQYEYISGDDENPSKLDGSNVTEQVQSSIQPPSHSQSNVHALDSSEPIVSSNDDEDEMEVLFENTLWEELHKTLQQIDITGVNGYPFFVLNQLLRTYKPISGLHLCFFFDYNDAPYFYRLKKEINGEVKELLSCRMVNITGSTEMAESDVAESIRLLWGSDEILREEIFPNMLKSLLHQSEDLRSSMVYKLHLEEADQGKNHDQSWVIVKEIRYRRRKQDIIFYIFSLESSNLYRITNKEKETIEDIDNPDRRQSQKEHKGDFKN